MQEKTLPLNYLDSNQQSKKIYASMLEPICREYGLTRNELDILLFLANNPGFDRAADIVSIRKIAKSHVSLSVNALQTRNLILRQSEAGDRRSAHLKLTENAQPIVQAGQRVQKQFFEQLFEGLSRQELEQWARIQMKICRNIEAMEA